MDINRSTLDALFTTYSAAWTEGLSQGPADDYRTLVSEFPSASASNFYAWMDKIPGFRKWVGDRVYNNVSTKRFEVHNENFEDTVRLSLADIEDDQYGLYTPIVRMMAYSWMDLMRSKVVEVFTANQETFDGKALFANDHPYGDGNTLDNLTTSALTQASFEAAFLAASAWTFSDGNLVRPRFTHLVVGEKLRGTAWNLVNSETVDNGSGVQIANPNKDRVALLVWPELTGTYDDYWFLVDASKPVKPVALQIRKAPVPTMDTDPETVERSGFVDFLASGRMAAAPTFPHLVYGGIL